MEQVQSEDEDSDEKTNLNPGNNQAENQMYLQTTLLRHKLFLGDQTASTTEKVVSEHDTSVEIVNSLRVLNFSSNFQLLNLEFDYLNVLSALMPPPPFPPPL